MGLGWSSRIKTSPKGALGNMDKIIEEATLSGLSSDEESVGRMRKNAFFPNQEQLKMYMAGIPIAQWKHTSNRPENMTGQTIL